SRPTFSTDRRTGKPPMETGHLATHDHETNKPPAGRLADATAASFPLSFAQRRLWFFEEMEPGNPAHHLADLMRIRGPLDATALESALTDIVRRHEVLRSVFHRAGAGPMQRA